MSRLGEWSFRGYLPHYNADATVQLITFRLADSLPAETNAKLAELASNGAELRQRIEKYLDAGFGSGLLRRQENASVVQSALQYFHASRYLLHAWVVMPNHVHVLAEPLSSHLVGQIVHSWKSFTARSIAKNEPEFVEKVGRVSQPYYFDRYIRSEQHYRSAVSYIHENPVKAGLVSDLSDWRWSSCSLLV